MGFFDFLKTTTRYSQKPEASLLRLDARREFIVEPYAKEIEGARVLDLASHDGRWSYALSAAGAREVIGIEARRDLIDQFDEYPSGEIKDRVRFIQGDIFEELPRLIAAGEKFDVVAIYGLYYHIMDHYTLLKLVKQVGAKLVIIDSEFLRRKDAPIIRLGIERTENPLNTIEHESGQAKAPIGIASRPAVELMAETLGYSTEWADWETLPEDRRKGLGEYYRDKSHWKLRGTCALRLS